MRLWLWLEVEVVTERGLEAAKVRVRGEGAAVYLGLVMGMKMVLKKERYIN